MKIKLYIVTYNNSFVLNKTLNSLFKTKEYSNIEVIIINNHTNFKCNYNVNVKHNIVRPDFSTGHLARDWNCAIIDGFKNLQNPDCDIVITSQDDMVFSENWVNKLLKYHETYNFITSSWGDGFCSYLPESIINVGLWDERFNTIEYQEADYFNRQKLFNKDKCSINDFHHNRILNPLFKNDDDSFVKRASDELPTRKPSKHNFNLLKSKYDEPLEFRDNLSYKNKQTILYPYFEKDIMNINEKYEIPEE
jgi:hypothetical protein